MAHSLYPLLLTPVQENRNKGGNLLPAFLGASADLSVAEPDVHWLTVTDDDRDTMVSNGQWQGQLLADLLGEHADAIVGRRHAEERRFPLYARILDVGRRQPLQVHPDLPTAAPGRPSEANSKFWYCLAAEPGAELIAGLRQRATRLQVVSRLGSRNLWELFQTFPARPGDAFLVPPGRVHALGTGVLVLEIGRSTAPPLHIGCWHDPQPTPEEQRDALDSVHFQDRRVARISQETGRVSHTRKVPLVLHCPHFVIDEIRIVDHFFDRTDDARFHLLIPVRGNVRVQAGTAEADLHQGHACCVPAASGEYKIYAKSDRADLVRVTVQKV